MEMINEITVLDFYLEQIRYDNIKFLRGRDALKKPLEEEILLLKGEGEMHSRIQVAKRLWKLLFEASMTYIDPDKNGYDELFRFFDEYVNFEELIFASDSFYRDHTMHCLWVYFLGEYIIRNEEFKEIVKDVNSDYRIPVSMNRFLKQSKNSNMFRGATDVLDIIEKSKDYDESIRCVAALTHDLGYPIKKIGIINSSIKKVLPYFGIKNYDEFNFQYGDIQENFITKFIELLSVSIDFNTNQPTKEQREVLLKIFDFDEKMEVKGVRENSLDSLNDEEVANVREVLRFQPKMMNNVSLYLRYSSDFEEYQHGIMSAFLLMKTLRCFKNIKLGYYNNVDMNLRFINLSDMQAKKDILSAVTDHTSDGYQISNIKDYSPYLTFVDELEEFSRISRANQNRQYVNEFCKTSLYMDNGYLNIDFVFDNMNIENLDPEKAFKGRCKRFLTLFDINNLSPELKIRLRCIGRLDYDNNTYALEIGRKYANISINGEKQDIPKYLKSKQFASSEDYQNM